MYIFSTWWAREFPLTPFRAWANSAVVVEKGWKISCGLFGMVAFTVTKLQNYPRLERQNHLEAVFREHSTIDSWNLLNVFKVVSFGVDICCMSRESWFLEIRFCSSSFFHLSSPGCVNGYLFAAIDSSFCKAKDPENKYLENARSLLEPIKVQSEEKNKPKQKHRTRWNMWRFY